MDLINYCFNNYENLNFENEKDLEIAKNFVNTFIKDELFKKNRNYKQLRAFIHIYGNLKMIDYNVKTNIITTDPGTSKKKYKITRFFDRQNDESNLYGECDEEKIRVQLTNYLIRSLYTNDKSNFTRLINTINHELKHAVSYKNIDFYNTIITRQNYQNLKFNLFDQACLTKEESLSKNKKNDYEIRKYYHDKYMEYYFFFEEEIGAFKQGYESVINEFKNYENIVDSYEFIRNKYVSRRFTEMYDYVNVEFINSILKDDYVRSLPLYVNNKEIFNLEFDLNGNKKSLNEIIKNKYKQLDLLNTMILMNPEDKNLQKILLNNEIEKTFNEIGYNLIIRGENIEGLNILDVLEMLNYGLKYEELRLLDNDFYTGIMDKRINREYIQKRIDKIKELKGEIYGKRNSTKLYK